ncbi:MAG: flagellar M-ring protein FliF [Anaerolineales bacterium]|nr:flagellar M-ring protein FliF [Anaerolineales bacterium]
MLAQLRTQSLTFWQRQSRTQRIVLIALIVTGLLAIAGFLTWASTPNYAVAFSGLSESDAGEIVQKLTDAGIPYRLEDNGTILVTTDQVYEVRLSMARQGLPQNGTVGYELFSGTTLGMTEFTQRVNYQRALEGELERTIGSLEAVQGVRVHIVTPEKAILSADQAQTTASITLKFKIGQKLDASQVRAITNLVAASIEGLKPENVVILDVAGNLLTVEGGAAAETGSNAETEAHRAAENAHAALIETKVRNLLDQALGPNKSVVKAAVSMNWDKVNVLTQAVDPGTSTIRSSQVLTEAYGGNGLATGGIPGALTNLPLLSTTTTVSGTEATDYLRQENTTNFEFTQVESQQVVAPGQIERISLSVLVDGITDTARLQSLETVIAAAGGIQTQRGDVVAVESLDFDHTYYDQQAASLEQDAQLELYIQIGLAVLAGLAVIALLWYVQKLLNNLRLASAEAWQPLLVPAAALAAAATPAGLPAGAQAALGAPATPGQIPGQGGAPASGPVFAEPEPATPQRSAADEQVEKVLVRMAEEAPSTIAEVIRLWLSEDEKKHG